MSAMLAPLKKIGDRCQSAAMVLAVAVGLAIAPKDGQAGPIPLEEAWESLDGPQPHGPGVPLVSHLPHNSGGFASDSMAFEGPGAPVVYQYAADNFQLPYDSQVRRIVVWGFYNSQILPLTDETFQINIHEPRASDGLPGDIVFSETVVNPFREWTGRNVISAAGGREYRFVIDLTTPFSLLAAETRWLSFYQVGDPNSSFRWEFSINPPPTDGQALNNANFPNWQSTFPSVNGNTAFELYSVPEPASLLMLGCGLSACLFRRRTFR